LGSLSRFLREKSNDPLLFWYSPPVPFS
jgi:hypothetical protein